MDMSRAERILLERDRAAEAAKKREEKRQEEPDPEEDPPKEQPEAEPEPRKRQVKNRKKKTPDVPHVPCQVLQRNTRRLRGGSEGQKGTVSGTPTLHQTSPRQDQRRSAQHLSGEYRGTLTLPNKSQKN